MRGWRRGRALNVVLKDAAVRAVVAVERTPAAVAVAVVFRVAGVAQVTSGVHGAG